MVNSSQKSDALVDTVRVSFKARVWKTAYWMLGSNAASQVLRLFSNLVLTRLLAPEAFGLMAAVSTIYFALSMFSDLGVWQSVVKSDRAYADSFIGTAQSIEFLRGLILTVLMLLSAAGLYLGMFTGLFKTTSVYADAQLPSMVAFVGLCALLDGLVSMKFALAQRSLQGDRIAKLELTAQVAAAISTITLVWLTGSIWGLLAGWLVSSCVRVALSNLYLSGPWIAPRWNALYASEMFKYGKWIFVSSVIGFFAANTEKIIFGNYLSLNQFGVFAIASALVSAVTAIYSTLLSQVIFPGLSMALNDQLNVTRIYTRFQQLADLLLGLIAGGLFTCGQWLVWVLYDARYHEAGWMLQLLGLTMLGLRYQVVEQFMFATDRPDLVSANNLLRALFLVVGIPTFFYFEEARGAIFAVVLAQFSSWPLCIYFKWREGLLSLKSEYVWAPAFVGGAGAGHLVNLALLAIVHSLS